MVCRDFQTALSHQLSAQGRQAAAELIPEEPSVRQRLHRQNIDGNINSFPSRTQFLSRMCLKFIESLHTNIANLALGKTRLWIQRTIFVLGGGEQFLKKTSPSQQKLLKTKWCKGSPREKSRASASYCPGPVFIDVKIILGQAFAHQKKSCAT